MKYITLLIHFNLNEKQVFQRYLTETNFMNLSKSLQDMSSRLTKESSQQYAL